MSKIGVGIGEDFPADDTKPAEAPERDRRDENDAEYAARREAYRKWREQRREWRRQWHAKRRECRKQWRDEWRARRETFQRELHDSIRKNFQEGAGEKSDDKSDDHFRAEPQRFEPHAGFDHVLLWAVLGILAAIALVSFVFQHIFVIVGVIALLALFVSYYRGHDPFAFEAGAQPSREAAH